MNISNSILLINPNFREIQLSRICSRYTPAIPLELFYIAKILTQQTLQNKIIDLWALDKNIKEYSQDIKNCEFIVFNTGISYIFWKEPITDIFFLKKQIISIKEINNNAKIIIIGPHGTALPETFFDSRVDYIIRGEPEFVVSSLISALDLHIKIPEGVCYRRNNQWVLSKSYGIVKRLDALPIIDYKNVNIDKYMWPSVESPAQKMVLYEASRGCTYNCSFCFRKGSRDIYRKKSIRKIQKEIHEIKKNNINYVYLIDECFGLDKIWTRQVCAIFEKEGIFWRCQTRPELMDEKIIDIYAKSGCYKVEIGLESVDEKILKDIGKENVNLDKLKSYIFQLINYKVKVTIYFTIGFPNESKDTINKLYKYCLLFPLDKVNPDIGIVIPYPTTRLMSIKRGSSVKKWESINDYIGILGNNFSSTSIKKEFNIFRINIFLEQIRLKVGKLKKEGKLYMYLIHRLYYIWGKIMLVFPELYSISKEIINYLEYKLNKRVKPYIFENHD